MKKKLLWSVLVITIFLLMACGKEEGSVGEPSEEAPQKVETVETSVVEVDEDILQEPVVTQEPIVPTALPEKEVEEAGETIPEVVEESAEGNSESKMTEEEYWQAYLETLSYPSHKEEYAETIYEVICSLPEEKPESSLKQKDVECDILQWLNATYAMFVNGKGDDFHYIGGYNDEFNSRKDYLSDQLEDSWGITDRATAIETISWLALEGHTYDYADTVMLMDVMGFLDSDEAVSAYFTEAMSMEEITQEDAEFAVEYYLHLKEIYEACGDNGIDAWDYCRIMQLCGNCYYLGYLTLEESLTIQLAVAQTIQEQFDSWVEMNDSYYYGYSYWNYGSYMVSFRKMSYDELMEMEDSPYKILDFNMSLEKFW